jgi:hypothetical protein
MYYRILSGSVKHKGMHSTSRVRDVAIPRQQATSIAGVGDVIPRLALFGLVRSRSVASRRERKGLEDVLEDRAALEAEEKNKLDKHTVKRMA